MNINATLIAQAISFAILIGFTVKFVWPLLIDAIDERNKRIADGLAAADAGHRALHEARERGDLQVRESHERATEIMLQADKRVAQVLDEAKANAKAEADRMLAAARAEIVQEAARARDALREQVAALAVAGATQILQREVDAKAHAELLDRLKKQL